MLAPFFECCVGRRDDYAVQRADGRYQRAFHSLTYEAVFLHLQGVHTLGSYVINEQGLCSFAVFDSDEPSGLVDLTHVQSHLAGVGVPSYLELSRRGAHLRVFFAPLAPPASVRAWLLPYCPANVEFYPKQDVLTPAVPLGSLVRLPLGIHRLTGECYPFVRVVNGSCVPVASSLSDVLHWFGSVQRVQVPVFVPSLVAASAQDGTQTTIPFKKAVPRSNAVPYATIRDWCMQQDPFVVIGRYVALSEKGIGCCPFGAHHSDGVDTHPSFYVYRPTAPDVCCWYCHAWKRGGSVFDFLRYYYGLDARELWLRILSGGRF